MLKQLVKNIQNHVKAMTRNAEFVELFDVDNDSVVFYVSDPNSIEAGVEATPDGEFLFNDGMKVVVENGIVTSVEKPVEEAPVEEMPAEETIETVETVEEKPAEEPTEEPEVDKDAKIAELEAEVEKLKADLEAEKAAVTEKEEEIKEIEDDLKEIQNFYTQVNKGKSERVEENVEKKKFCFVGK